MGANEWIAFGGLILTFFVVLFGILKYFQSRIDKVYATMSKQAESNRKEFNAIHSSYVRSDDLTNHINRIEAGVNQVNARLDQLFTVMIKNDSKS